MQKILYAIQLKPAEDWLSSNLQSNNVVSTGSAAYREAVLPALQTAPADILVYRESLKGSQDTFELMRKIRTTFPQVRIVFIANEQPLTSPLLCRLVCLGIYDIINSNNPSLMDIKDFIIHPRDYRYASKFFSQEEMEKMVPAPAEPAAPVEEPHKWGGALSGVLGKLASVVAVPNTAAPAAAPQPAAETPSIPKVDMEAMRGAMLEEARRTAQAEIPQLVETQVAAATATLQDDLNQRNTAISKLSSELKEKTSSEASLKRQLEEAIQLRQNIEERFRTFRNEADLATQHYEAQLVSLQTTKPPEWYQEQTQKWLTERASYQTKLTACDEQIKDLRSQLADATLERDRLAKLLEEKAQEVEALQLSVPRDISDAVDGTLGADFTVISDNELECKASPAGEGRIIAFLGTKHGVGNTTVALNTAISLANCGYKTCYMELNRHFPMVNEFFEFSNIVRGLDTATAALQQNNVKLASQCLIKPHGILPPNKKALAKIYKRLPGPLHFLLYSNDFIRRCKDGTAPNLSEAEFKDLAYFLTAQEHYSYVIIDLQPDDQPAINTVLDGICHAHKLVMTMTQDTHSISTAGYLIRTLARSKNGDLLRNAEFVINQFSSANKMPVGKIGEFLHVPARNFSRISLDSKGYMDACYAAVPYVLSKGKYSNEYIDLRLKLTK